MSKLQAHSTRILSEGPMPYLCTAYLALELALNLGDKLT